MNRGEIYPILLLIGVILSIFVVLPTSTITAQTTQPGPAADKIIARSYSIAAAVDAIKKGEIDVYMYALRPAQAEQLRGVEGVKLISAAAGLIELTLNPAPVYIHELDGKVTSPEEAAQKVSQATGKTVPAAAISNMYYDEKRGKTIVEFGAFPGRGVNPFAFREIRFAMNYVVDRNSFVANVMRGYAVPMYTFLSQYDPDYSVIADIIAKYEFGYNPTLAKQIVTKVMTAIGAENKGGFWYYDGQPVTVTLLIRSEDERRDLGYMFNAELTILGFNTKPVEMRFAQAINIIYGTDPAEFQWHVYTAGWGKGGIGRYDSGTIAQFCASWYGYMPGWLETGWWNYRNDTIDELTQKIFQGVFKSKEERDQLYRTASEMCIQESVRVWVAARLDTWPVRTEVQGVTLDLGAGLRGIWNLREMHVPGRSELRVGHLYVWTSTSEWNSWGGFTDVYSVDWARATYDPMMWVHPFNGEPIPFRVQYTVVTAGPDGKLDVPAKAKIYDVTQKKWVEVGPGKQATSMVVFDLSKLVGTKFHNGITITMADLVGAIALQYELVYDPTYSSLEPRIAGNTKQWLDTVVAWEFNDQAKTMTVYVNYWHFDENYIASWAVAGPANNPLEIHVASFELALDRRDETKIVFYRRSGFETLSLVVPKHVQLIKETLLKYKNNNAILERVNRLTDGRMTMDEWNRRIDADVNWINTYNLAWISYGPFMLTKLDTQAQILELTAFRDPTYPFKPGDWYFGFPVRTEVTSIKVETPVGEKIAVGYDAKITVEVSGIGTLNVMYILKDPEGNILATGNAQKLAANKFQIILSSELTKKMKVDYPYTIIIIATSDTVAEPGVVRKLLVTTAYTPPATTPQTPPTTPPTTPTTTPTTPLTTPVTTPTPTPTETPTPAPDYTLPIITVVVIVIGLVAVFFVLKKK